MRRDDDLALLQCALRNMLPPVVGVHVDQLANTDGELLQAERSLVTGWSEKRRKEFAAGRACARGALAKLRLPLVPILRGEAGEPIWPTGIVGSITHDNGWCAAAAGYGRELAAVGIDIVRVQSLPETIVRLFCSSREMTRRTSNLAHSPSLTPIVVFSIKESAVKCLYPIVRRPIDFRELEIDLEQEQPRVDAIAELQCRYTIAAGHVVSCVWLVNDVAS